MAGAEPATYPWRPERVRVGTVGKPHGLDGTIVVDGPCGWFAFQPGRRVLVDGVERRLRRRAGTDLRPLIAFVDVDDREGAEVLRGAALEVPRDRLPEPANDDFFRFDLVGCDVFQDGRPVATVASVEDGVAHDILVLDDGAPTRVPFVAAIVTAVDIVGRRLEVVPGFDLGL